MIKNRVMVSSVLQLAGPGWILGRTFLNYAAGLRSYKFPCRLMFQLNADTGAVRKSAKKFTQL